MICTMCGHSGTPKMITKGDLGTEIVLWLCFGLGILYSIWRHASRYNGCAKCGSPNVVPLDSPIGRKLAHETKNAPPLDESTKSKKNTFEEMVRRANQ